MKNLFLFCALIISTSAFAQEPVYKNFETDSAAQPRGGIPFFNAFLQNNLRKPVVVEASGLSGRVILGAIVEIDGRVSDVKLMQSFRPDCDREALRVFSLFNAWQPAYKGGKAVRQTVTMPVTFKASAPYAFANGTRITYYDTKQNLLPDSSARAEFRQVTPLDTNGLPNGDIVVFQRKRQEWKESYRLPFVRQKIEERSPWGKPVFRQGIQQTTKQWQGWVTDIDQDGKAVRRVFYENDKQTNYELTYHANGVVAQRTDYGDQENTLRSWHPNGQIKQVWTVPKPKTMTITQPDQIAAFWDSTGRQLVSEGNGTVIDIQPVMSRSDSSRQTRLIEQGLLKAGMKQGIWTGRYADGSYHYEERYDKGICQGGKALTAGSDTVRYAVHQQQPEFKGGMQGLGNFLAQNLQYPPNAQRANAQGKVYISFVVCTDGSLCDYEVQSGVHPELDQEALRVVKAMNGRWKPGNQRGQNVRVKYNLPINFTLQ
ncbi:energy transducer TonB [Spirosoma utsteinense]|uniref:TonB family protein n=1 Tax=Spirosoma utsteinense TaxID=2585773 RepID=A0ABR6W1J1_9BACT|nr:energy transducer TonB [Spirosoma utsteinense]MBC3788189.1 TonB family protein [Spirosoma utsteinense]MBC3790462.1 TonB family protein [Spirosoma utsteinense]